jgi:hypothetical protein
MCVDVSEIDGRTTAWSPNNSIGGRRCRPFLQHPQRQQTGNWEAPTIDTDKYDDLRSEFRSLPTALFPRHIFQPTIHFGVYISLVLPFCCVCLAGARQICRSSFYPWKFSCYASRFFDGRVSLWPLFSMASIYPSTIRFTMLVPCNGARYKW